MNSLELQSLIFEQNTTRRFLKTYETQQEKCFNIQLFRNHAFEMVQHTIGAFLDYAGLGVNFIYGGYDDSLSFTELDVTADMVIVWVDVESYKDIDIKDFLDDRLSALRAQSSSPILVIVHGIEYTNSNSNVTVFPLCMIRNKLGDKFTDLRAKAVTGTILSATAMTAISRELGLRYLPAMLRPLQKAIVVDLDNTLYSGVLGEDGTDGIVLTDGHLKLQQKLKDLVAEGFFLCVASKNDEKDVVQLFKSRKDFILSWEDFSKVCASWDDKSSSIASIAEYLNIHHDSIIFIDDNIGELTAVSMAYPGIKIIHASDNGEVTAAVLSEFPGLLKLNILNEDLIRTKDIQAKAERNSIKNRLSPEDYIRSLKITLTFSVNNPFHAQRIWELSNKTNQFIFSYARYELAKVEQLLTDKSYCFVTVSLSDKLSDSGIVGVCVASLTGDFISVEELFISCRALGRGIDDIIVLGAIKSASDHLNNNMVKLAFKEGDRNEPAKIFVEKHLKEYIEEARPFNYILPNDLITIIKDKEHKNEG